MKLIKLISPLIILATLTTLVLSGCSVVPKVLQGEFSPMSPAQAKKQHIMNEPVRWSGRIIQTINRKDKTCFEIVESETYRDLSPKRVIPANGGRFLACKEGFLEPTAFDKRNVTITGTLVAYTEQDIGEFKYEYPVVKTDKVYIWRKNPRFNNYRNNSIFVHHNFTHFSCRHSSIRGYCY